MTFGNPAPFLATARARRVLIMRSTVRITRPTTTRAWDDVTGQYTEPSRTVVYEGPAQVKPRSISPARLDTIASAEVATGGYEVCLPYDAPRIDMADSVEVLASDDTWLVGRALPVAHVEVGAENRTHRSVVVYDHDYPAVNDASR